MIKNIKTVALKAAAKITCLRRITWVAGTDALELLFKAQIRSTMEFAPLTWGSAAPTHLELLNKTQRRAERLIYGDQVEPKLTSLQHRRDVAGLTTMFKIHIEKVEHLRPLQQAPRPVRRATRAAAAVGAHRCLEEVRCNTLHHQMQFVPRYTRLWNQFASSAQDDVFKSIQHFKGIVNNWLLER